MNSPKRNGGTEKRLKVLSVIVLCCLLPGVAGAEPNAKELKADKVLVLKKERRLELIREGKVFKSYRIALGGNPVGAKAMQGDQKTPEGMYVIDRRNPQSLYHLSLHISYPNADDIRRARKNQVDPGGDIMIHGLPKQYAWVGKAQAEHDWTWGCIAVSNEEIDEISRLVPNGTPIEIRPLLNPIQSSACRSL